MIAFNGQEWRFFLQRSGGMSVFTVNEEYDPLSTSLRG